MGGPFDVEAWYEAAAETEQFRYWQAYHRIEPWGAWRDNLHAGIIASAIYGTSANGPSEINPAKFILDTDPNRHEDDGPSEEALLAQGAAMGLKFIEGK